MSSSKITVYSIKKQVFPPLKKNLYSTQELKNSLILFEQSKRRYHDFMQKDEIEVRVIMYYAMNGKFLT
jgi:hypothetical protein